MLSQKEKRYIRSIPQSKVVKIKPFNLKATKVANEIIQKVKEAAPNLRVIHMGASGLGISGQRDLDIYALAKPERFKDHLPDLIRLFGKPKSEKPNSVAWEFDDKGYSIEFYLTDPNSRSMKRQISVFEILKGNKKLLKEYERLKESMDGKSFRDYQRKKYEFYHRILGS